MPFPGLATFSSVMHSMPVAAPDASSLHIADFLPLSLFVSAILFFNQHLLLLLLNVKATQFFETLCCLHFSTHSPKLFTVYPPMPFPGLATFSSVMHLMPVAAPGLRLHFGQLRQLRQFRQRRHLRRFVLDGILGSLIFGGLIFGGLIFGGLIFGGFIRCEEPDELDARDRLDEREELEDREEPNGVRLKRFP